MKRALFAVIILLLIGAFAYRFYHAGQPILVESIADVQAREGIPVEIEPVTRKTVELWRTFSGTAEGITQTAVISNAAEEVISVKRNIGDRVESGEVLIQLTRRKSLMGYQQAVAAYANTKKEVQRLEAIYKEGAISEQQLDNAQMQLKIARANLNAAEATLDIIAPVDGVIVQRNVDVGDQTQPGKPLMVIADLSEALIKINVSGRDARKLHKGQKARISESDLALEGTVHKIALSADPESRLVEIELRFDNSGGALIPGTLITTDVLLESAQDVPVVAKRALHKEAHGDMVWIVDTNNIAHYKKVEVGLVNTTAVEIRQGLTAGDRVIVSGASLLEGEPKVNIVSESQKES